CINPAKSYVARHPELSSEHRAILLSGRVPDGRDVAGMTKEQVRLAMGTDPDQFTKIDGADAWVYFNKGESGASPSPESGRRRRRLGRRSSPDGSEDASAFGRPRGMASDNSPAADSSSSEQSSSAKKSHGRTTTIFFSGDLAARAETTRD